MLVAVHHGNLTLQKVVQKVVAVSRCTTRGYFLDAVLSDSPFSCPVPEAAEMVNKRSMRRESIPASVPSKTIIE